MSEKQQIRLMYDIMKTRKSKYNHVLNEQIIEKI